MQNAMPPPDLFAFLDSRLLAKEKKLIVAQLESVSRRAKLLKSTLKSNRRRLTAAKIVGKMQERDLEVAAKEAEHLRSTLRAL